MKASTTATVCVEERNVAVGSEYAACSSSGVRPEGFGVLFVTAGRAPWAASAACLTAALLRSAFVSELEISRTPRQPAEPGGGTLHRFCAR